MRTTLDIPTQLLAEAMSLSHSENKTKTIVLALENLIQKSKIQEIKKFKGKIDLDINLNSLRDRCSMIQSVVGFDLHQY